MMSSKTRSGMIATFGNQTLTIARCGIMTLLAFTANAAMDNQEYYTIRCEDPIPHTFECSGENVVKLLKQFITDTNSKGISGTNLEAAKSILKSHDEADNDGNRASILQIIPRFLEKQDIDMRDVATRAGVTVPTQATLQQYVDRKPCQPNAERGNPSKKRKDLLEQIQRAIAIERKLKGNNDVGVTRIGSQPGKIEKEIIAKQLTEQRTIKEFHHYSQMSQCAYRTERQKSLQAHWQGKAYFSKQGRFGERWKPRLTIQAHFLHATEKLSRDEVKKLSDAKLNEIASRIAPQIRSAMRNAGKKSRNRYNSYKKQFRVEKIFNYIKQLRDGRGNTEAARQERRWNVLNSMAPSTMSSPNPLLSTDVDDTDLKEDDP